jgi:antitoxin (DNA-binding transcriptional repressor) of toxin-antitoxin stability system
MIYKIVLSNTNDTIPLDSNDLPKVLESIQKGNKLIITKEGVFNPSYLVAIMFDSTRSKAEVEHIEIYKGKTPYLESPFARQLSSKMEMLDAGSRAKAQEEMSRQERKLKR